MRNAKRHTGNMWNRGNIGTKLEQVNTLKTNGLSATVPVFPMFCGRSLLSPKYTHTRERVRNQESKNLDFRGEEKILPYARKSNGTSGTHGTYISNLLRKRYLECSTCVPAVSYFVGVA